MCERTLGYIDGNAHNAEIIKNAFTLVRAPEGAEEMKNIRRRDNGSYEGRIVIDGKRYSVYANTQAECVKKLKELKKSPIILQKSEKLYDFSKKWLEIYKKDNVVASSYYTYNLIVEKYISQISKPLNKLSILDIQRFLNSIPPTRIREYVFLTLRQVLKKAFELDLIKKDIAQFLKKGNINHGKRNSLTLNEQKLILDHLGDSTFFARIITYLLTGCRPGEINSLELKNDDDNFIYIGGSKTKRAKRYVKISPKFRAFFIENKEIITSVNNTKSFNRQFVKFCKKIGIESTLYSLRHTFATNLYYLGVPDKERQVYMGHASATLTNDIYTDFDPNIKAEDIQKLYGEWYPNF